MSKIMNRAHFKLPANPWEKLSLKTADLTRVQAMVRAAVETRELVSILGPRGSGKTRAVRRALGQHSGVRTVEPLRLTRERLHMGDIETAIVRDLSDETPRRSGRGALAPGEENTGRGGPARPGGAGDRRRARAAPPDGAGVEAAARARVASGARRSLAWC